MPKTSTIAPEKLQDAVAERAKAEDEKRERKAVRRGQKIAKYVLKQAAKGKTDMPARAHSGPSIVTENQITDRESDIVRSLLKEHDIESDSYPNYLGADMWEDRIAITAIAGKKITPSAEYARRLGFRDNRAAREAKEAAVRAIQRAAFQEQQAIQEGRYNLTSHESPTQIKPRPNRNRHEEPILVGQTSKYARRIGAREYITTDEPHGVVNFKRFASDEAYAEALSTKVIQCVDIMVHDPTRDTVLLGTRQQEPHAGDWVIGGGMRAGESVAEAAHRNMSRELHIDIDDSLLTTVDDYKFIWDSRAQGPVLDENGQEVTGCHMSSTLVSYPMRQEEVDLTSFNEEYTDVKWVPTSDILRAPEGTYHPCLVDMVADTKRLTA